MGLFSSKKKIYVSSVVYNMAGDEADRPNYMKSLVAQHAAAPLNMRGDIGRTINRGLLSGPLQDRQGFVRWCRNKYPEYMLKGSLVGSREIPRMTLDLKSYIVKSDPAAMLEIGSYFIERADFFYWAENFVASTYPAKINEAWTCDIMGDNLTVVITFEDTSTTSFVLGDFDITKTYFYVRYFEVTYTPMGVEAGRVPHIWAYEMGSNDYPKIEAMLVESVPEAEYYPVIPLRQDNVPVDESPYFDEVSEIYKKLAGRGKLAELLTSIADNESIGDIDYAAIVFGVCANDNTRAGKRYIYNFIKRLMSVQRSDLAEFLRWKDRAEVAAGTGASVNSPALNYLEIKGGEAYNSNYQFVISWAAIDESYHTGLGKPEAVKGDIWFAEAASIAFRVGDLATIKVVDLFWQTGAGSYKKLRIYGMMHQNFVYGGKAVTTELWAGIQDIDESEFFFPMHSPTLKRLNIRDATQVSSASTLIVFNCYVVKKIRWYQRGIFRILLVILSIAIAVMINPAALSAASGLLGTNLAVGTALGVSGLTAVIIGAAANAIAGMILVSLIQTVAVDLFGEKLGALIGAIVGYVSMSFGSFTGGSFNIAWDQLMLPGNLFKLVEAITGGIVQLVQGSISELNDKLGKLTDEYEDDTQEIEDRYSDVLGYSGVVYDPLQFSQVMDNSVSTSSRFVESSDAFIKRTLLVGPDIVEISHTMISEFPKLSLTLPSAFT